MPVPPNFLPVHPYTTYEIVQVLTACSDVLYRELAVGSYGGGLDVAVEGRLKSLYSVHRKMGRKGVGVSEARARGGAIVARGVFGVGRGTGAPHGRC